MDRIFRKVALDRLSSPEQLDLLLQVTNVRSWLALIGIGMLVTTLFVWGGASSIPITLSTPAVLGAERTAYIFLSPAELAKISPGMVVTIEWLDDSGSRHTGYIATIHKIPSTPQTVGELISSPSLAELLATNQITFQVDIELTEELAPIGRIGTASIELAQHEPVDLLIPSLSSRE